jgi:molybdopterin converting factor small subunit
MPKIQFTGHLRRFLAVPEAEVDAGDVRAALDRVFADHPRLRGYVLDEQGAVRRHVAIYVNGQPIADRVRQSDKLRPGDDVYVLQALTGG